MGQFDIVFEHIAKADFVIEVVDARCPNITRSRKLEEFVVKRQNKKLIIVINKADLVPPKFAQQTLEEFSSEFPTCFVSSKEREGMEFLKTILSKQLPNKNLRGVVVGFPNVGKSSIINFLSKKKGASTSPMPGHTKKAQTIRVSEKLMIFDVPGILPPDEKFSVLTSTLRPEKSKHVVKDAVELLNAISKAEGNNFEEAYGIKLDFNIELIEEVAKKLNFKLTKGEWDVERAARTIVYDWNSGKLKAWGFD